MKIEFSGMLGILYHQIQMKMKINMKVVFNVTISKEKSDELILFEIYLNLVKMLCS